VFTLEGLLAAVVVIVALVFALQTVVVTPATSGSSSSAADPREVESALRANVASGNVERAALFWDRDTADLAKFHNAARFRYYTKSNFQTGNYPALLFALNDRFGETTSMSVIVHYHDRSGSVASQRMVDGGAPGEGAVSASTTVTLYDSDRLVAADGTRTDRTLEAVDSASDERFYAPDISSTDVYNVLRVEVIVW